MRKTKKTKQKKVIFTFASPDPPATLRARIREVAGAKSMPYQDTPEGFDLGVERGGHSGGYWYVATLTETEGGSELRGRIVYRTYHKDSELREDTKWERMRDWIGIAVIVVFLSPVFLIALVIWGIMLLIGKLRKKPLQATMSTEEKLTHFMTESMGCSVLEE